MLANFKTQSSAYVDYILRHDEDEEPLSRLVATKIVVTQSDADNLLSLNFKGVNWNSIILQIASLTILDFEKYSSKFKDMFDMPQFLTFGVAIITKLLKSVGIGHEEFRAWAGVADSFATNTVYEVAMPFVRNGFRSFLVEITDTCRTYLAEDCLTLPRRRSIGSDSLSYEEMRCKVASDTRGIELQRQAKMGGGAIASAGPAPGVGGVLTPNGKKVPGKGSVSSGGGAKALSPTASAAGSLIGVVKLATNGRVLKIGGGASATFFDMGKLMGAVKIGKDAAFFASQLPHNASLLAAALTKGELQKRARFVPPGTDQRFFNPNGKWSPSFASTFEIAATHDLVTEADFQ
jgi:hypothetical protein